MKRYSHWRVQTTKPGGMIYGGRWWDVGLEATLLYRRLSERVGKEYVRTELIGLDPDGGEHVIQHTELRTDLYENVQPPVVEQFEQMPLFAASE